MSLKTFKKGGVHPPANKLAASASIVVLEPQPNQKICIPLGQHIGAPPTLLVAKGDRVKVGQLIAQSNGFVSANIHSSVSGTVESVDPQPDMTGYRKPAVTIVVEGDEWLPTIDRSTQLKRDIDLTAQEIVKRIADCGIVGMGGATFPAHVKFSIPKGKKANILIINGVECEPYLCSDHRLMLEHSHEIMVGTQILMRVLDVSRAVIGIENNKPDAIKKFRSIVKEYQGIEIQPLKIKYPQGGEKMLIRAITKREVPSGGLPIDVGAVVANVGTTYAVYEAVQHNKPLIERVVTVTGKKLSRSANYLVRLGTPITSLIAAVGGLPDDTGKIISGGPMMGKALLTSDVPVTKGTSGVVLMPDTEARKPEPQPCIRCGNCVQACPMGLEPYLLVKLSKAGRFAEMEPERAMDCLECGSCSFVCPAKIRILDFVKLGKTEVGNLIRARKANK